MLGVRLHYYSDSRFHSLKGNQIKDTSWPENVQIFPVHASFGGSISILYKRRSCSASEWSSLGHAHVGSLFTIEDQEQVGL